MQDFDAIIMRDGRVLHVPWGTHTDIIARYNVPENTSLVRQNYWEYDILAPFIEGGGLQARGIEEPPEVVVRAAGRVTENLCNWHVGRNLKTIPAEWGDIVEHVYQVRGRRAPKYLNGRGGVYFTGEIDHLSDVHIMRLIGDAHIGRLDGSSVVESMSGHARIDELAGTALIKDMREKASIGKMSGSSCVDSFCHSAVVESMCDSARVVLMFGASRVLELRDRATCGRAYDGVVFTATKPADEKALLASRDRYKTIKIVREGESVFA